MAPALAPAAFPYTLSAVTKALPLPHGLTLSLVYSQDASGVVQRMADLVRQKLALAGITVNERQVQLLEVYNYSKNLANAPDLYLATPAPDAANPDTWERIVWHSNGALDFFRYADKAVNAVMDQSLRQANPAAAPSFLLALAPIYVFYFKLSRLPGSGQTSLSDAPAGPTGLLVVDGVLAGRLDVVGDAGQHLVLPGLPLAFVPVIVPFGTAC